MKPIILIFASLIGALQVDANAQNISGNSSRTCTLILYNGPAIIGLGVRGDLAFDGRNLTFIPSAKSSLYKFNDQIKPLVIPANEISNIRRNWFLLVPNRLIVTTEKRERFRFVMFGKRKYFINQIKKRTRS